MRRWVLISVFFGCLLALCVCLGGSLAFAENDAPTSSADSSTSAGGSAVPVQVVSLDDARAMVDDALDRSTTVYVQRLDSDSKATGERLDAIDSSLVALAKANDAKSEPSPAVVVLDAEQWQTIQRCWGWAKSAGAVALFVMLCCTLFVCVLIGQRLWTAFTRGWRR